MSRINRTNLETREITIETNINQYAEGSCLISFGNTKVICTASYDKTVPRFLHGSGKGWLTAEYSMLPRSTHSRSKREAASGRQGGRTLEIQRLIGRSLRAAIDLEKLGESQIIIDCDVIQADGGTRTASITGGYVALALCIKNLIDDNILAENPLKSNIAAISLGLNGNDILVDLDYEEDSQIGVDANFVFNSKEEIIEVQASSEEQTLNLEQLNLMSQTALSTCKKIFELQNQILGEF